MFVLRSFLTSALVGGPVGSSVTFEGITNLTASSMLTPLPKSVQKLFGYLLTNSHRKMTIQLCTLTRGVPSKS